MERSWICISKVLCFVWGTSNRENSKRTPSSWNKTIRNCRWYIYWYSWSTNCHCGCKPYLYSSVLCSTACLKKYHKASNSVLSLFSWTVERSWSSRMFKYWMLIIKFQIDYLVFIRSMREGNFKLFVKTLISLIKWLFIFDHYNHDRWLSVQIQYLLSLPITCPQLYQEFERGNFVV